MSEPRLISPLLDGYLMGDPISDHHGVRSCPALREETEERAIVKIISVPASQAQLDALLLTGALKDAEEAKSYFKKRVEDIVKEAAAISKLSKAGGFLPYKSSQTVPMADGIGFDVYLLAPYHRSLQSLMQSGTMTHLAAANLGLDMCAALALCRRAGYLYVDLKPENIFLSENHGYCIGDLGLMSLTSIKFASLPEKYRSRYTPPEITDAYATLNDTIDVYALGLVLYQVYNNGELPPENGPMVPPMYADYEMAAIILKACAPDPADRWADPAQMGQALVEHMQRNVVNDDPIIPPPVEPVTVPDEDPEDFLTEEENDRELAELLASIPDEELPAEDPSLPPEEETSLPDEDAADVAPAEPDADTDGPGDTAQIDAPTEPAAEEEGPDDAPAYPRTELTEDGVTAEVAEMLAQADELLMMELPEPVVAPDPIDVPIPPPIVPEPQIPEAETGPEAEDTAVAADEPAATDDTNSEEETALPPVTDSQDAPPPEEEAPDDEAVDPAYDPELQLKKRRARWWLTLGAAIASMIAVFFICRALYQNYFLLTIDDLTITGTGDKISVSVVTKADEEKLIVVCTDTYGNTLRSSVTNGQATFSDLNPNTQYKIQVQIEGRYQLMGHTTGSYTTVAKTQILNLAAVTGPENGSVILSFTVDGPDSERWNVEYHAPGIEARTASFVGKHITLTGLDTTVEYTFRVFPEDELYMSGDDTITFQPQQAVYAQELAVTAYEGGSMTVTWNAPSDTQELNWIVRCFSEGGYDQSVTTADTTCTFEGLDTATGYTVTVMADGMTKGQSIEVSPDPVHITAFHHERTSPWELMLRWDYTGTMPEGGWKISCAIDGGTPVTSLCEENSVTIPLTPGATYAVDVRPAGEVTFFPMDFTYGPVETAMFSSHTVTAEHMALTLHRCPAEEGWTAADLVDTETVDTFTSTENVCLLIQLSKRYDVSDQRITTTFVIRDSKNSLVSALESVQTWDEMWHDRKCAVAIPQLPQTPGSYTLDIYMQEQYVSSLSFTIT